LSIDSALELLPAGHPLRAVHHARLQLGHCRVALGRQ
jgi:hypothetical protein